MENKWVRGAIPALLLHMSIGTVYCWGTFSNEISKFIGWDASTVGWAFSLAIFFLGMSAAFMGGMVEKNIHRSSLIATITFGGGMLGTAFFIWYGGQHQHSLLSLIGIFVCYGFIMGIGLGTGYLSPVKTLTLWFSKTPGLATGLAVAGFGAAKAIASPIMTAILNSDTANGVWKMFLYMGIAYIVMMFVGHLLLKKPSDWHEPQKVAKGNRAIDVIAKKPVTFIGIWLMFYLNIAAGLALIHQDKAIFTGLGLDTGLVATLLAVSSIFNAGGRLCFSAISDRLKDRNTVYKIIFVMSIALTAIVLFTGCLTPIQGTELYAGSKNGLLVVISIVLLLLVNAGYGGGFSTLPNLLGDRFGKANYSAIHGIALSAWGVAGLTGNQFAQLIEEATHNPTNVLWMTLGMYVVAMVCSQFLVNWNKD